MPASMGIALYAKPILSLLFSGQDRAVEIASPLLAILGASVLFSGMITTTNAILQSYRQTVKPIISMAIGSLIKILAAYFLIGIPEIGVYGAPVSTLICNLSVTVMNIVFIGKRLPKSSKNSGMGKTYIRPLMASLLAIALSFAVYLSIESYAENIKVSFLVAFFVAVAAYCALALLLGAVSREDIADIPMGEKILKFADKIKKNKLKDGRKNDG